MLATGPADTAPMTNGVSASASSSLSDTGQSEVVWNLRQSLDAARIDALGAPAASVRCWLAELRCHTEPECSHVLQSKSIVPSAQAAAAATSGSHRISPSATIELIGNRSNLISTEFKKVFKNVSRARLKSLSSQVGALTTQIRSLLHSMTSLGLLTAPGSIAKLDIALRRHCAKLEEVTKSCQFRLMFVQQLTGLELSLLSENDKKPSSEPLTKELSRLAHAFSRLVDSVLGSLAHRLISGVAMSEEPTAILNDVTHLAMRSDHLGNIITRVGGLSLLIGLCRDVTLQCHWAPCLRAIAAVCVSADAVVRFQEDRGLDLLRILLGDSGLPEEVRSEAAGVVAQITSPSFCKARGKHPLGPSLRPLAADLVRALTLLCKEASHPDVFLLSSAALANLTFMDADINEALLRCHTVRVLVNACQLSKAESVFARDQVATLFANLAVSRKSHREITALNGVELLLQFLAESPRDCRSASEREACARVQQKAAIALGRLSADSNNAHIVIGCEGLVRLTRLCRDPEERNGSDAVLVASLAALRKIHLACGGEDFEEAVLKDLVLPKMIDAFLACSKMEESFV